MSIVLEDMRGIGLTIQMILKKLLPILELLPFEELDCHAKSGMGNNEERKGVIWRKRNE